jgi:hypothetical protein
MNENKKDRNKSFMLLMLGRIVSDTGTGVQAVVMPLFFRTKLSYTDTQYGYLQMVFILGALIGSILSIKVREVMNLRKRNVEVALMIQKCLQYTLN